MALAPDACMLNVQEICFEENRSWRLDTLPRGDRLATVVGPSCFRFSLNDIVTKRTIPVFRTERTIGQHTLRQAQPVR